MKLYALHDYDLNLKEKGSFPVTLENAREYNKKGYGIHFAPNEINGSRKIENVVKINYWFADYDKGSKQEQMRKINKLLFRPSIIVESKKGYHLYWKAMNATIDNFYSISKGIAIKLDADEAVCQANRIMRMPGFYHMKDKDNPFLIKMVFKSKDTYTEKEMLYSFHYNKPVKKMRCGSFNSLDNKDKMLNPENWDKIFFLDRIVEGCRNNEFTRITLWLRDEGFSSHEITETIYEMNKRIVEPLDEKEIASILRGKV